MCSNVSIFVHTFTFPVNISNLRWVNLNNPQGNITSYLLVWINTGLACPIVTIHANRELCSQCWIRGGWGTQVEIERETNGPKRETQNTIHVKGDLDEKKHNWFKAKVMNVIRSYWCNLSYIFDGSRNMTTTKNPKLESFVSWERWK